MDEVTFTKAEVEVLRSLVRQMGQPAQVFSAELVEDEGFDARTRKIIREEIASLAGKALRRSQDVTLTRSPIHNESEAAANRAIAHFWGEILAEYGGD